MVNPLDAKVYKWTDENGRTHYTDNEGKIPQRYKKENMETYKKKDKPDETLAKYVCKIPPDPETEKEIKDHLAAIKNFEEQIAENENSKFYRSKEAVVWLIQGILTPLTRSKKNIPNVEAIIIKEKGELINSTFDLMKTPTLVTIKRSQA